MRMNDLRRCLQPEAPLRLYRLPFVYVMEVPIGPGLIGQRPQPLGRLPCGRIRGQDMPMHPCWPMNLGADMPARAVDHDNHLLPRPGIDRLGKLRQSTRERGNRYWWISLLPRLHYRRQGFLQAAYAAGSAGTWRGRGTLEVQPRRRSTSHPAGGARGAPASRSSRLPPSRSFTSVNVTGWDCTRLSPAASPQPARPPAPPGSGQP
jgi:hypothetical protein